MPTSIPTNYFRDNLSKLSLKLVKGRLAGEIVEKFPQLVHQTKKGLCKYKALSYQ